MYQPVDGPVTYINKSVTTVAAELRVGASAAIDRKVLIIQSQANSIYIGFNSSVTSSNGIELRKRQTMFLEVGDKVAVFAIASSGTLDVRIVELA